MLFFLSLPGFIVQLFFIVHFVFCFGVSRHFEPKKPCKKNRQNSQRHLNYIKSSCIIFCAKMFGYSQITYCIQEKATSFGNKNFKLRLHMSQTFPIPLNHILPSRTKSIFTYQAFINYNFLCT